MRELSAAMQRAMGLSEEGLVSLAGNERIRALPEALEALAALQTDAASQGFEVAACSGFRSFQAQAHIFGAKFRGERVILNINEEPLTTVPQDPIARLQAILLFSAMPGFSRHHFGSDFDIYARNLLPPGQTLQLTCKEYAPGSYFHEFGHYLQENLARFGFAYPYMLSAPSAPAAAAGAAANNQDASVQVGQEPWHISFIAGARTFLNSFDSEAALDYVSSCPDLEFAPFVREVMTPERIKAVLRFDVC